MWVGVVIQCVSFVMYRTCFVDERKEMEEANWGGQFGCAVVASMVSGSGFLVFPTLLLCRGSAMGSSVCWDGRLGGSKSALSKISLTLFDDSVWLLERDRTVAAVRLFNINIVADAPES